MAEESSFFNAEIVNGVPDREYLAERFARYFSSFIKNGVFPNPSTNLQVIAIDNNMTIRVRAGFGWINGYFYENTDDLILRLDNADGVVNRIDRIVLRLDFRNREIRSHVKKGNFASSPTAPELQRDEDVYELALADINVNAGFINITQSSITDLRLNKNLCGIVKGTIEEIDTTTLLAQLEAWKSEEIDDFNTWRLNQENIYNDWYNTTTTSFAAEFNVWFESIKGILSGDVAGNLLNEINKVKEALASIEITAKRATVEDKENLFEVDEEGSKNVEIALNQLAHRCKNLDTEVNGQRSKGITIVNSLIDMI
ncbi:TPA: hypothetical protein KNH94_000159 [Clostridioides difficile]|nr:hypothetical protein [Clostridioides difficile]